MFKILLGYFKPHKKLLAFVLSIVAIFALVELSIPVFSRHILNDLIPAGNLNEVIKIAAIMIVLLVLYAIGHFLVGYYGHILGVSIEKDMRMQAFEKLQELSFDYYDVNKTGVIMSRMTDDLHNVAEFMHHGAEEFINVTLILVIGYLYLIRLDFWLTNIMFVLFLGLMGLSTISRKKMTAGFRRLRKEHGEINSRLEGSISGIRLTRAFSNESFEVARFEQDNDVYIQAYYQAYRTLGLTNAVNQFSMQLISVAVLVFGAFLVMDGRFSTGDMFAYYIYFSMLVTPIRRLMTMLETFQQGWTGFERYMELMNAPVSVKNRKHARDCVLEGDLSLEGVTFKYDEKNTVLDNFSLTIKEGTMVALVGPSGVGKTTITQLIPRFYDINRGDIKIGNESIYDMTLASLRSQISYVQQDVTIFWGTIEENIAYGNPDATHDEIVDAAKKAGIHDFIETLPKKYDTMVGERGVMLSGGQKQRISIARIFLKDPKILILDEATSALDNITEAYIQQSLETLAQGRTVIVVAHRLTTVQHADQIVVMGKGGISQMGTHQELVAQEGHYKNLYEASSGNTLLEIEEF